MKVVIGSDRRGLDYKTRLAAYMEQRGIEVVDVGTHENIPCDSPVFAAAVAKLVASGECQYGVLICATGTGMVIAANKIRGAMCAVGYDDEVTKLMRAHNDVNIIAFGQNHMSYEDVERRLGIFLDTDFIGLHHALRVNQIKDLDEGKEIHQSPILNSDWV